MPRFSFAVQFTFVAIFSLVLAACSPKDVKTDTGEAPTMQTSETPKTKAPKTATPKSIFKNTLHHEIDISIVPATHTMVATDTLTIPADLAKDGLRILLNADLQVTKLDGTINLKRVAENRNADDLGMDRDNDTADSAIKVNVYELSGFKGGEAEISLSISGEINNPIEQLGAEYARGFSSSPGLIEERGAYLAGATYWVPTVEDTLITYDMRVTLPETWSSVSQGKREQNNTKGGKHIDKWSASTPTEEIYIIAAKFTQYEMPIGNVTAMAYLRTPDEAMANKYLETTAQYMEMYRGLVGPYPYSKFALVENFWETGYGMPSFTLLGSQVIRFPFILHSSYPHELLHNWWGNSVYIDFDTGNWAEGLTTYMADHLVAEQRGKGAEYRRATLQRYTSYVDETNDFPLRKFIGRTDSPTQAVGYGKTSMVFDMLRQVVGDEYFTRALQKFYRDKKYAVGTWDDIRASFEAVTDKDLKPFFDQWVGGVGAPELAIEKAAMEGDSLTLMLHQNQKGGVFNLQIPVALFYQDHVETHTVHMSKRQQVFSVPTKDKLIRVEVDPAFNVFRRLHWAEIPPSFGAAFGADKVTIVLPTRTTPALNSRYSKLAALWSERGNVEIVKDSDIGALPTKGAIWVFGANNKYYGMVKHSLNDFDASIGDTSVSFGKKDLSTAENSTIIVVRHKDNPEVVVVGLTAHSDAAVAGLARKLPHYGKYSYLAFTGNDPTNSAKGQWPAIGSPLVAVLDKTKATKAKLKPRPALAELKPVFDAGRMMDVVKTLASETYEGRGVGTKGLDKTANYLEDAFKKAGLKPGGDTGYFQAFTVPGPDGKPAQVRNVVGVIAGKNPDFAGQSVVLSAHYDHLGYGWPDVREKFKGQIHPGADDNASGVAVMLEMAKSLSKSAPDRTIVFLASSAEESGLLGAKHYIKTAKTYPADKIFANVNLDSVGRATDKLMIFGGSSAREWPFIFMGVEATTGVKSELVAQDIDASDHKAFLDANIPAVHVFGALNEDYSRPSDTADKIDPASLMRTATLTKEVVAYLANRPKPMTNQITPKTDDKTAPPASDLPKQKQGRTVSTGTMPDFAFSGVGVKVKMVSPDSPGAKAGLMKGDVITHFGGTPIKDLKAYTNALSDYNPGDKVEVIIERAGEKLNLQIVLAKR